MNNIQRVSALTVALLTLTGGIALAQPLFNESGNGLQAQQMRPGRGNWGEEKGPNHDHLMETLNLDENQRQQMRAIHERNSTQMNQSRQTLQAAHQRMRELMGSSSASEQELRAQHNEIQRLQQEMGNLRFQSMLEMRNILTPEQRSQMNEMHQQRRMNRDSNSRMGRPSTGLRNINPEEAAQMRQRMQNLRNNSETAR
ncbi:Spy/CpxP family protein refolding chaperone [Spirulina subsalsa FACHB-351]|uniref:Spy/CpxP family protein refolding chaperone n=1 Tax=Spirulina subsalsa FACHB-351 TaxID=234711 RepID=A0ABT3L3K5_9CYAN|nr:Spy/CpxP family protein refolding chaperone [Spirulina subsalsa]MCW6036081.1 Spy/CpxP family protein refolding chaperone [Spirulina subsalsa FACHB-351]